MFVGFLGALIGGLASLGGSGLSSALAIKESQKNRDFQERMSNTAYQRSMTDMKLAGLNPILAYQKGGASTPGGSTAAIPDMGKSISSGVQAGKLMGAQLGQIKATTAHTQAQTAMINAGLPKANVFGRLWQKGADTAGSAKALMIEAESDWRVQQDRKRADQNRRNVTLPGGRPASWFPGKRSPDATRLPRLPRNTQPPRRGY